MNVICARCGFCAPVLSEVEGATVNCPKCTEKMLAVEWTKEAEAAQRTGLGLQPDGYPRTIVADCLGCNKQQLGVLTTDRRFICPECHPKSLVAFWTNEIEKLSLANQKQAHERAEAISAQQRAQARQRGEDAYSGPKLVVGVIIISLIIMISLSTSSWQKSPSGGDVCPRCSGSGKAETIVCPLCGGRGRLYYGGELCKACGASGRFTPSCPVCNGTGRKPSN